MNRKTTSTVLLLAGLAFAGIIFHSISIAQPTSAEKELQVGRFQMVANPHQGSPEYYILDTATGRVHIKGGGTVSRPILK